MWDDDRGQVRQLIEIDFEEHEGVTTVRLTHGNLWDEEAVSSHREGRDATFDDFARTLER